MSAINARTNASAAATVLQVACVVAARELGTDPTDLVLFPEGVGPGEIREAQRAFPNALIVGAVRESKSSPAIPLSTAGLPHCRAVMLYRERNLIDYLKLGWDGRTKGTGNLAQSAVHDFGKVCVGVLVCMDVNHGDFSRSVIDQIKSSSAALKLLCIPADMTGDWFPDDTPLFPPKFGGIHVVLCNGVSTYPQYRCRSFVTDTRGKKIAVQEGLAPIRIALPLVSSRNAR